MKHFHLFIYLFICPWRSWEVSSLSFLALCYFFVASALRWRIFITRTVLLLSGRFFGNVLKGNDDSIFILPRSLVKLQYHSQISGSAKHLLTLKVLLQRYCVLISIGLLVMPVIQSVVRFSFDPKVPWKVLTYLELELWHIPVTVCYIKRTGRSWSCFKSIQRWKYTR
jgi:hypothetical protein